MENAFGQPQNIVVLGGSSDIARAITKKLCAARSHTVVLCGRNQELLNAAAGEARKFGATKTDTVLFDAEDPSNAIATITDAFEKVGDKVDLVIVAVGLLGDQTTYENDAVLATRMAMVNFTWPVAALTELRRRLVAQGSGRILVISSVGAVRVRRNAYLYGGTKAGLDRLCQGLADSLEGTGVSLQLLRPGPVRSRMTAGLPDAPFTTGVNEVADNVMRGLANGDRVIWSPPLLRYVFSILRHLPAPLWRKVSDR
ncbi:MAG TPA: SDR family NAD(P)-dependent oxidoreductase [Acidimicrobiales bacterium]